MSVPVLPAMTPPPAGVLPLPAQPALSPSSNHGVKISEVAGTPVHARGEGSGIWDYLTLSVSAATLCSRDKDYRRVKNCQGADDDSGLVPPAILDWLLPGHSLSVDAFERRGWQGYRQRADVYAPGMATPVGLIAKEGNADTICVSITGSGMFAVNLARARLALEHYGARITRIDAAFDDLEGDFLALDLLRYDAVTGAFDASSRPSTRTYVDDLGTGKGSALYVGVKGDKQLNVYEKGKQQGDQYSPHLRCEVRLWAKNRHLGLDMLASPLGVIVGAYPRLAAYLPHAAPSRAKTMRRQVEARADSMCDWLQSAAGKSIGLLREAGRQAGATDGEILDLISRDGMPARFGGVPDVIAQYRTAEYLQGAIK